MARRHNARRRKNKRYDEDPMTLPATNKNMVLHSSSTPEVPSRETGWDPFEVWRTRVLLPRLAESAAEKASGAAVSHPSVKLVRP